MERVAQRDEMQSYLTQDFNIVYHAQEVGELRCHQRVED